jgi:hypothetical protein
MLVDRLAKCDPNDPSLLQSFHESYHAHIKSLYVRISALEQQNQQMEHFQNTWKELTQLLTSGMAYVLLTEIVLQEKPDAVTVIVFILLTVIEIQKIKT